MFRDFLFVYFVITSVVSVLHVRVRMNAFPDGDVQLKFLVHVGNPKPVSDLNDKMRLIAEGGAQAKQLDEIIRDEDANDTRAPASIAEDLKDK